MSAYSGCCEQDGGIGRSKRCSRTELARVGGDVQLAGWRVSGGRAPSGGERQRSESSEGATELGFPGPALGKMQGEAALAAKRQGCGIGVPWASWRIPAWADSHNEPLANQRGYQ